MSTIFRITDYVSYDEAYDMGFALIAEQYNRICDLKPHDKTSYDLRYQSLQNLKRARDMLMKDLLEYIKIKQDANRKDN